MAVADCAALHRSLNEDELIKFYFMKGYTYNNIRSFLETKHSIKLTEDQLRWKLKKLGLKRRGEDVQSSIEEVQAAIEVGTRTHTHKINYYCQCCHDVNNL